MTLNPTSGPVGTVIAITGSGFPASTDGNVISPWVSKLLTTTPDGTFSTTVTVPENTAGGDYPIQADFPSGGSIEASGTFTVTAAITLSPIAGPCNTRVTFTGSGFAAGASGSVFFDSDRDGIYDPGEPGQRGPYFVTATRIGTFGVVFDLTVPMVAGGEYSICADIPRGGSLEAGATFSVTRDMWFDPSRGPAGSKIYTVGSGFAANTSGIAFIDLNHNARHDFLEPSESLTTESNGSFWQFLTVPPKTDAGQYDVMVDCPIGLPVEESGTFTVLP